MLAKSMVIAVLAQGATKGRASRSIPEGVTSYESPGWNRVGPPLSWMRYPTLPTAWDAIVDHGVLAPHDFDGDTPEVDYFADEGGVR